jgi:hypothetical protein
MRETVRGRAVMSGDPAASRPDGFRPPRCFLLKRIDGPREFRERE